VSPISTTTIFIGDDGAEVTLHSTASSNGCLVYLSETALLDDDLSPKKADLDPESPLRDSKQRLSFCGVRIDSNVEEKDSLNGCQLSALHENHINSLWGLTVNLDALCGAWQVFDFASNTEDIPGGNISPSNTTKVNQCQPNEGVGTTIRQRNLNVSARNERLESLRHKLYPFEESDGVFFKKTRSFSTVQNGNFTATNTQAKPNDWLASLDCDHILNESNNRQSPAAVRYRSNMEDYDSDPEDFAKNRTTASNVKATQDYLIPEMYERSVHNARWVVQTFLNARHTFVLHDSTKRESQAVSLWIERGQFLHSNMLAPRLVWCRKCRPSSTSWSSVQHNDMLESIDLLDVKRILDVTSIDRSLFPFAKRERCVQIKTLENSWIFETASKTEKEYFAISLKLTVSRLATLLIVSDDNMVEEFFNDFETKVGNEEEILTSTT
jgi:hypothetical protein